MTNNNSRPGLPCTRIPLGSIPVGSYSPTPWWCWPLLPVLALIVLPILIFQFGWRKKK